MFFYGNVSCITAGVQIVWKALTVRSSIPAMQQSSFMYLLLKARFPLAFNVNNVARGLIRHLGQSQLGFWMVDRAGLLGLSTKTHCIGIRSNALQKTVYYHEVSRVFRNDQLEDSLAHILNLSSLFTFNLLAVSLLSLWWKHAVFSVPQFYSNSLWVCMPSYQFFGPHSSSFPPAAKAVLLSCKLQRQNILTIF